MKLGDNDLYGSLQARRRCSESGEYTTKATVEKVDKMPLCQAWYPPNTVMRWTSLARNWPQR